MFRIARHAGMFVAALLLGIAVQGCASRRGMELVEARLRDREDEIARLRSQIASATTEVTVARRDADQLRGQLVGRGEAVVLPEQADALYRAKGLTINGLVTAGLDTDDTPGDDAFVTTIIPQDEQGAAVKLPGSLEIVLSEGASHVKTVVDRWAFSPEESRDLWQQDLFAGGFRLQLPLDRRPSHEEVTLRARLVTADGRTFEATHDFTLRTGDSKPNEQSVARISNPYVPLPPVDDFEFEEPEQPPGGLEIRPTSANVDGTPDPNGNGLDRTRPVRTSDTLRFGDGARYQ